MEKKAVKAVTRKQKYLAAIAGDGVAPSPITSHEKLMYNIAEKTNEGGGSGGGVEIVRFVKSKSADSNTEGTCDHTLDELLQAYAAGKAILCYIADYNGFMTPLGFLVVYDDPDNSNAITPTFIYSDETKTYRIIAFMTADTLSVTRVEAQ